MTSSQFKKFLYIHVFHRKNLSAANRMLFFVELYFFFSDAYSDSVVVVPLIGSVYMVDKVAAFYVDKVVGSLK